MSGCISAPAHLLEFFLVVCAGGSDDDLLRGDDEGALGGCRAVEHLFHHGLEGADHFALGHILGRTLHLIALQILGIVNGNGNSAVVGSQICELPTTEVVGIWLRDSKKGV